jgi:transposase, IS6 family
MAERNLAVDHVTIWRWVQRYAPVLNQRIRRELPDRIGPGGSMKPI